MAPKYIKQNLEFALSRIELNGLQEKALLKSRHILQVDIVLPRTGVARKSAAREIVLKKGVYSFEDEPWTKKTVFREEIEDHCGVAVSVTEPVSVQKIRRFIRLTAKYALKMGADFMEKAMVGYADIASSPLDAIAAMIGEKDVPKTIAQGVVDFDKLPQNGATAEIQVPLLRPLTEKPVGTLVLKIASSS